MLEYACKVLITLSLNFKVTRFYFHITLMHVYEYVKFKSEKITTFHISYMITESTRPCWKDIAHIKQNCLITCMHATTFYVCHKNLMRNVSMFCKSFETLKSSVYAMQTYVKATSQ